jgi:hypothetical protein
MRDGMDDQERDYLPPDDHWSVRVHTLGDSFPFVLFYTRLGKHAKLGGRFHSEEKYNQADGYPPIVTRKNRAAHTPGSY